MDSFIGALIALYVLIKKSKPGRARDWGWDYHISGGLMAGLIALFDDELT